MAKRVRTFITCANCNRDLPADKALKMLEPAPGVKDLGLACFHCGTWKHFYYETDAMREAQPVTPETKEAYNKLYDAEQVRVKEMLDDKGR